MLLGFHDLEVTGLAYATLEGVNEATNQSSYM
jgi:hypothetical protein